MPLLRIIWEETVSVSTKLVIGKQSKSGQWFNSFLLALRVPLACAGGSGDAQGEPARPGVQ